MIGTSGGVIKVRTVRRNAEMGKPWVVDVMEGMQGAPWEPVPGRGGIEIKSRVELPRVAGLPPNI